MARPEQSLQICQMTVAQWEATFRDEDACAAYLTARRWPNGVHCPRCGSSRVYPLRATKGKWECPDCRPSGHRFSATSGTIFDNTNIGLQQWFRVIHLMLTSERRINSRHIMRHMGSGSYMTAWSMCHRIRETLQDMEFKKLFGVVEVNKAFAGGLAKNRRKDKHGDRSRRTSRGDAAIVAGAAAPKSTVGTRVVKNA